MVLTIERATELIREHDSRVEAERRGLVKMPLKGLNRYVLIQKGVLEHREVTFEAWDSYAHDQSAYGEVGPIFAQALEKMEIEGYKGPSEEQITHYDDRGEINSVSGAGLN